MICSIKKYFIFFIVLLSLINTNLCGYATEAVKVKPICFDISNSLIFIPIKASAEININEHIKYSKCDDINGVEIEISPAEYLPQPETINFSEGGVSEFYITHSGNTVKIKLVFDKKYNVANFKLGNINNNLIITMTPLQPYNMNYYINTYRDFDSSAKDYKENLVLTAKTIEKQVIEVNNSASEKGAMNEINQAFANSNNNQNEIYTSVIVEDLTKDIKLRSKYYLFNAGVNEDTFKITGVGNVCVQKPFLLDNPLRMVFDLPNTLVNSDLHGKEFTLSNGDILKIAQFNPTTTRLVVTSESAKQYIRVLSSDSQSIILANPRNILTTHLSPYKANITKFNYQKTDNVDNFLVEFDKPLQYAIKRTNEYLFLYFLNAEKYNDTNFHAVIKNTPYSELSIHLLSTGMRLRFPIKNKDNLALYISPDGKLLKLSSSAQQQEEIKQSPQKIKEMTKKEGGIKASPKMTNKNNHKVVVLDAGHGGKDCGALRDNITEKQINLDVCMKIQSILKKKGYKVYMTRTDDTYVSLEDRTIYTEGINPGAFVSVHVNSCNSDAPKGIETHYYHEEGIELADAVHKHLIKRINTTNRGLLKSRFYVINHTTVPAILVEIGFISNPEERQELVTQQRQQATAEGIAEGIIEFLKSLDK